jgi:hypothetical protein
MDPQGRRGELLGAGGAGEEGREVRSRAGVSGRGRRARRGEGGALGECSVFVFVVVNFFVSFFIVVVFSSSLCL